jgi:hypothetical protein
LLNIKALITIARAVMAAGKILFSMTELWIKTKISISDYVCKA